MSKDYGSCAVLIVLIASMPAQTPLTPMSLFLSLGHTYFISHLHILSLTLSHSLSLSQTLFHAPYLTHAHTLIHLSTAPTLTHTFSLRQSWCETFVQVLNRFKVMVTANWFYLHYTFRLICYQLKQDCRWMVVHRLKSMYWAAAENHK